MRAIVLVGFLAACSAAPEPPVEAVRVTVPVDLRSCPVAPAAVPTPPKPRTFETVVEWGRLHERRAQEAVRALEVCRMRLVRLGEIVER